MTIDKEKLKALAEAAATHVPNDDEYRSPGYDKDCWHDDACDFANTMSPGTILALLAEIEGLHAQHGRDSGELRKLCSARDSARRQRDQLKSENERLRGPEETLVVCQKGKPFTFMSKDPCRYGLCEVTYAAPVRVLIVERDQLKAENEALRKDAERYRWLRQSGQCDWDASFEKLEIRIKTPHFDCGDINACIDGAMGKEKTQ